MDAKTRRFDHVLRDMITQHAAMVRHFNAIKRSIPHFRRSAYRFASFLIEAQKNWHNEFVNYVKTHDIDFDRWMDEHFDVIEQLGGDRRQLLRSIEEGMTEQQYIKQFNLWGAKKQLAKAEARAGAADKHASQAVTADMTDAQRADYYKGQYNALLTENVDVRKQLTTVTIQLEQLEKDFARFERIVEGRKKKLG